MKIVEAMRDVELVPPDETVQSAAQIMEDLDAGSIIIGENGMPTGILTTRDIIIRIVAPGGDARTLRVGEVMSTELVTCRENDDAARIASMMVERQIRRVPVVDAAGKLVGIVRLEDITKQASGTGENPERIEDPSPDERRAAAADKPFLDKT
jgi:CBS domain-containing protein